MTLVPMEGTLSQQEGTDTPLKQIRENLDSPLRASYVICIRLPRTPTVKRCYSQFANLSGTRDGNVINEGRKCH